MKKHYAEIAKMLDAYQTAVNESAIVSITDLNGKIVYVNEKFIEISGYSMNEAKGKTHKLINSGYHPPEFFKEMWVTIKSGELWRGQVKNKTKSGTYYWVDTIITPVKDSNSNIVQYLSIRNLITTQKENEEALTKIKDLLSKKKQQLKDAQQIARLGSWHMDLPNHVIEWTEETYRIFEISPGTPVTYELFLSRVMPEYKTAVDDAWRKALKTGYYEIEHPIQTASGIKWVFERARFEVDAALQLVTALGTVQDITEKKAIEEELKKSETLYRDLFNNNPSAVGILDKNTMRFLEVNETAVKLYGYTREEFRQLTAYDVRAPWEHNDLAKEISTDNYAFNTSTRNHLKKNGEIIIVEPYISEIEYDHKPAFLITINDVTGKLRIEQELARANELRLRETSKVRLETQENSRAEIGRELHDNINQLLVASVLFLKRADVNNAKNTVEHAIEEIRALSSTLVPPSLKFVSLEDSIKYLARNLKLTGILTDFNININESLYSEPHKINIYRIVQEQFSNIIKYAAASHVYVRLEEVGGLLTLEIIDNGKGFDQDQKDKGIGLNNIIYRAEAYNGKMTIESSLNKGCRICIRFYKQ